MNQTIDLRLQSRPDQQDRGNDNEVPDAPGAQPCQGKVVREPAIEGEKEKEMMPVVTMTIASVKAIFRFSCVLMAFLMELAC